MAHKFVVALVATLAASTASFKTDVSFATGMDGGEDSGQDITMKGEKFHYRLEGENTRVSETLPAANEFVFPKPRDEDGFIIVG